MLTRAIDIPELKGICPAIAGIRESFESLSRAHAPLLLVGESGCGKEEIARALHRHNGGTLSGFVVADGNKRSPQQLETFLFGEDAAFITANKGTVYFPEVGALTTALQSGLLRVIQDAEFFPLGRKQPVKTNARIMAGTTQDLGARARAGLFNPTFLEILQTHTLHLPPLRERREDIPELAAYFMLLEANELSIMSKSLSAAAVDKLCSLGWPGNLPQLDGVCRRLTAFSAGREIDIDDLPEDLIEQPEAGLDSWAGPLQAWAHDALAAGRSGLLNIVTPEMERILIRAAMEKTGGRRQEAAQLLGWGRNTLSRKIRDLGITAGEE